MRFVPKQISNINIADWCPNVHFSLWWLNIRNLIKENMINMNHYKHVKYSYIRCENQSLQKPPAKQTVRPEYFHVAYPDELHGDQLETLLLEALDDLADKSPLHTVRFDGDECAFVRHSADGTGRIRSAQKHTMCLNLQYVCRHLPLSKKHRNRFQASARSVTT